jgi:hypothetical protein
VSTKETLPLSSEEELVIPPPSRKAVRKVKAPPVVPSAGAPVPSSSSGHVSVFPFFYLMIRTRVAPEPIVGWLQPSGFDNLMIYLDKFFASLSQPIQDAVDIVVDLADQFIRMEAEYARLQEVAKSSTEQLAKANKLATEAQREAANLKKELDLLKAKMKEEEQLKIEAQAQADKKEGDLRKSVESLLGKLLQLLYLSIFSKYFSSYNSYSL